MTALSKLGVRTRVVAGTTAGAIRPAWAAAKTTKRTAITCKYNRSLMLIKIAAQYEFTINEIRLTCILSEQSNASSKQTMISDHISTPPL